MRSNPAFALALLLAAAGCARDAAFAAASADPPEPADAGDAAALTEPDAEPLDAERSPDATPPEAPEPPDALADSGEAPAADGGFEALYADVLHPAGCDNVYCHHAGAGGARAFWRWLTTERSALLPCREDAPPLVVPGDPEGSLLYLKVAPGLEVCGVKMPAAASETGLPPADAERVRAWIRDGARF